MKTFLTLGLGLLWMGISSAQTTKPAGSTTNAPKKPNTTKPVTTKKPAAKPLEVGQQHLGGIIIKLNADGKTGLIATIQDLEKQYNWTDAQTACNDLVVKGPNYDFTDWRLPTLEELQACQNLFYNNQGGFAPTAYWTTTKSPSQESAMCYVFDRNKPEGKPYVRTAALRVRPVRKF